MKKGIPPTVSNFMAVLNSMLTQYDQKMSARERHVNIYRLGNFLEAASKVNEDLISAGAKDDEVMTPEIAEAMFASMDRRFDLNFPPVKKVVKQLAAFLTNGKNPSLIS